ncbi:5-formyltetrahydrofolate cyclo-ligase [Arthrobacter sp. V4I6]|uniref:5-formyltetrahydrofolate cyclo-ligase n=1 Tax=unclassified Arthrobacter TaxID=235627 RepID=UPI0027865F59|nr:MULTISPECIES: 5-formyltetrahydrofolate cyclo-ligase [unclassified Arthrobacter]MDQ0820055.1 5-formyltetrahydrofolate cyclo-ligase [Arthrobacter sp. V1I7]MDQ0854237.1 5-formyltetrahydrofolate cyclo-ligase [Arthrobacter sp. V4I6]
MKATKEQIRAVHRTRRALLGPAALDAAGTAIAHHGLTWANRVAGGQPGTFAAYLGVGTEPPSLPLLSALHDAGHRVLLPVCEPGINLSWVYWTPTSAFVRSRFAPIREPVGEPCGPEIMRSAAGIFLPATAVDLSGNRIGQGGGYYDKFLTTLDSLFPGGSEPADGAGPLPPLPAIAVVYDGEVLPAGSIPVESFDRRVPSALTPGGFVRLL